MDTPDDSKPQAQAKVYSLTEVSDGQAKINYVLNHVDFKVIDALKLTIKILKRVKDLPPLAHDTKDIDFTAIEAVISEAEKHSGSVADIRPPGCLPPYPPGG